MVLEFRVTLSLSLYIYIYNVVTRDVLTCNREPCMTVYVLYVYVRTLPLVCADRRVRRVSTALRLSASVAPVYE